MQKVDVLIIVRTRNNFYRSNGNKEIKHMQSYIYISDVQHAGGLREEVAAVDTGGPCTTHH